VAVNLQLISARNAVVERRHSVRLKSTTEEALLDDLPNWVEALFPSASLTGDLPLPAALRVAAPRRPLPDGRFSVSARGQLEAASALGGAGAILLGAGLGERVRVSAGGLLGGSRAGALAQVSVTPWNPRGRVRPFVALEAAALFTSPVASAFGASVGVELAVRRGLLVGISAPAWWFASAPEGYRETYVFGATSATVRF
jgi:hypothetical protein